MNILSVTDDHSESVGGTAEAITHLARRMAASGHGVTIACAGPEPVRPPLGTELVHMSASAATGKWMWGEATGRTLGRLIARGCDLVHLHGVWAAPQWYAGRAARKVGVPAILTDHGMLGRWYWDYRGRAQYVKKKLYWHAFARPAFGQAVVHAITAAGATDLRSLFPRARIEIIPNAVDTRIVDAELGSETPDSRSPQRVIRFLGRLDPQKGIDLLLHAFAIAPLANEWRLEIAGYARVPRYRSFLERLVHELGMAQRVAFVGPKSGREKWAFLREAWVMAVPSRHEAIGLVNLESAACGTPTVTTKQTGLLDWECGGGMLIEPDVEELSSALVRAVEWHDSERSDRGRAMRGLIDRRYCWDVVGASWEQLYASVAA